MYDLKARTVNGLESFSIYTDVMNKYQLESMVDKGVTW
jgi:hypothetical protein